ncbi:S-adenosyl-L-methionine-dependent methyltransferase [Phakopsora pachyrhizi]|uniref:S-adenosyl-L-methionine-dependent methyltransferase n=1 Tax=Phakopsora pachyrhizi TaxID=170000 RepID=A0AAV0AKW1_PHAPC|nr:S-adenosyl-L-methionine-dependent methyltransferase [Phakopsora pachyrhizi]CAH7668097.1 S-adenosyl-L-methionine-dependent methyltransferase [Phakopsora pachyrhizi]
MIKDCWNLAFRLVESLAYDAIDRGLIPDIVIRSLVRFLSRRRLADLNHGNVEEKHQKKMEFIKQLRAKPVAIEQEKANEQHYEVPTTFIQSCLGKHMKYSCCYFPQMAEGLEEAEVLMLEDYCQKAKLEGGMRIMDLGCGWGSLSLYLAQKFPSSTVIALSNSRTQKAHIDLLAKERQISNLTVYTGDVMVFDLPFEPKFDRVISIEMLEHMKNYEFLFRKISSWLKPEGLFFAHTFCHVSQPYNFEEQDGWMAQNFFSGGTMPSLDLFSYFQRDLNLESSWFINGKHYGRTSELWLKRLDSNRARWIRPFGRRARVESSSDEEMRIRKTFYRFRTFFLAVAEFFALDDGQSWGVGHFLFSKKSTNLINSS